MCGRPGQKKRKGLHLGDFWRWLDSLHDIKLIVLYKRSGELKELDKTNSLKLQK